MIAFVITMARPPHRFTPAAQILLALFLVLFVGFSILGLMWLLFISAFMYRMWLASFHSDWIQREYEGWWGRYMRLETWLDRFVHLIAARIRIALAFVRPRSPDAADDRDGS